jgi:hypothetical protein
MALNIFLSVGRPFTPEQERLIASVEGYLKDHGLRARTVGRTEFTHKQPLQLINDLMDRSAGALVIALERISIRDGTEKGGPPEGQRLEGECLATPWNQIEAAIAYAKRIPLFVIRQKTVRPEGLLEGRYDWYVHAAALDPAFLQTAEFAGIFESWKRDVHARAGWFRYRS